MGKSLTYLLGAWEEFLRAWAGKHLVLFFDYDGTLTPIKPVPEQAVLAPKTRAALKALSQNPRCSVVIISGRALNDLKEKIAVDNVAYVGNHGLEIEDKNVRFEDHIPPQFLKTLAQVKAKLQEGLVSMGGVFVEDKGLTLSVHFRLADPKQEPLVKEIVREVCAPYAMRQKIRINSGKKVLELKPALDWNKGRAALWLLHKQELTQGSSDLFTVYVGDDVTDEDAFDALREKGVTVFVGQPGPSKAQYYLKTPDEVTEFLRRLLKLVDYAQL